MNVKNLIKNVVIPNTLGFIGSIIGNVKGGFDGMIKPKIVPPKIVFPIVWTILYILMGISAHLIEKSDSIAKGEALRVYYIQLVLNVLWPLFFFNFRWYLFSFILILVILVLSIIMIKKYYAINKTAAYLQIPYIIWLLFAGFLNLRVFMLN